MEQVIIKTFYNQSVIENPDLILDGYADRKVIQKKYDDEYLIKMSL